MPDIYTDLFANKTILSLILVAALFTIRYLIVKMIRSRTDVLSEEHRRYISHIKNGSVLALIISLIFIWWPELREFALSIAAVAVAFVIASKELILCISGAVLRATSGASSVGDWVEIGELRGEVIEQNILSTVLQEIDIKEGSYQYTGKTTTLPNSVFLSQSIKNMNFMRRFVFHSFTLTTEPKVNVFEATDLIEEKLRVYCEEFIELGKRYHAFIVKRSGMEIPSPEPSIRITTTNLGKSCFTVTLFCPTPQAVELEQKISRDFFEFYYEKKSLSKELEKSDES